MNQTAKRWVLFLAGIQCLAIGIVCNTRTNLGGGCLYQRFYVISQIYHISLGTASILLYLILIAIQILLLRKVSLQVLLK